MTGTIKEIIEAKSRAGEGAYLWLAHDGIAVLWASEEDSHTVDPLQRWELDPIEREPVFFHGNKNIWISELRKNVAGDNLDRTGLQ